VDLGVHLPLIQFDDDPLTLDRLHRTVDAARDGGYAALSSNDHLLFATPWLDGLAALAATVERSGSMPLATTIALVVVRGPAPLAKALAAIDVMSGGRVVAGVGPGSSPRDYEAVGIPFEELWPRFEQAVAELRRLVGPDSDLAPPPAREGGIPVWIGSWGSAAGLRRVRRLADGWLASAYNTTPELFGAARGQLPDGFPNALSTMWTWVTESRAERDRVLRDMLGPLLRRDPDELAEQVCIGPAEHCIELLSRYAEAGCERVYLWPLGDEAHQLAHVAGDVVPQV